MSIRADFQQARDLIQQRKFEEARQLLKTINHPRAEEWLIRLDVILQGNPEPSEIEKTFRELLELTQNTGLPHSSLYEAEQIVENGASIPQYTSASRFKFKNNERRYPGNPWHPAWLMALACFALVPGAGVAFALNWRRLGRPAWTVPTVIISGVSFLCSLSLIMLAVRQLNTAQPGTWAGISLAVAISLPIASLLVLVHLQNQAYTTWKTEGKTAMLNYQYRFRPLLLKASVFIFITALCGGAIFSLILPTNNDILPDNTRQFTFFSLEISEKWHEKLLSEVSYCQADDYSCLLVMYPLAYPDVTVALVHYNLEETMTVTALDSLLWDNVNLEGVYPYEKHPLLLDSVPAIMRTYAQRGKDGESYEMQLIAIHDQNLLEFTVHTDSYAQYKQLEHDVAVLYESIQFIPESPLTNEH